MSVRRMIITIAVVACALTVGCSAPSRLPESVATTASPPPATQSWEGPVPTETGSPDTPSTAPSPTPPRSGGTPVSRGRFQDAESGTYYFVSPSGNLHCAIDTFEAQPAAACQSDAPVANLRDCPDSPVVAFSPDRGAATGCTEGRPFYGGDRVLEYGQSLTVESLTCSSRTTGITCLDDDRRGFTAARAGFITWG
ncbi:hypothetical protein [Tessaracoccus palaemonis]|uniref:Uncharacterized protein n=1 Tax=Tessaracoccus palaemonis TaxID=2829499 RepID=A0ABX8SHD8_9ACTN|nr:hypothetical protein [Tessaracoccus palaemonis]QXT62806.1 hypothetical protein KDB89_13925 [Tessaracoccus palaemonis]